MASEGLKERRSRRSMRFGARFSDLRAGRAAFQRLRRAVQPKRKRKRLSHFLAKAVLIGRAQAARLAQTKERSTRRAQEKLKPTVEERCAILAVKGRPRA